MWVRGGGLALLLLLHQGYHGRMVQGFSGGPGWATRRHQQQQQQQQPRGMRGRSRALPPLEQQSGGGGGSGRTSSAPSSVKEMSRQMKEMRETMAGDEKTKAYMDALRGVGMRDYDAAETEMRLLDEAEGEDVLPQQYDPEFLKKYYSDRPQLALKRSAQLASAFSGFIGKLILDAVTGKLEENDVERTILLRESVTSLGPFYIKLAQALSIRPDILSPASMVELQKLCDKVPSYDSKLAFATIEKELGGPIDQFYSEISPEPLAAASLGQVYKATLRSNNATVAVKVQRPGVLETVSLDLYIARELGTFLNQYKFIAERTDIVALLDEFAYRFYDELDYEKECEYGIQMKKDMEHIQQVVIPFNYPEFTKRRVFTAEWIEGEKLSQSKADDVGELVDVGVLAYLTQLLDTGNFHSDPHPGNLIRTPEGKLAILDFGLMTQVTDDQKYGMVEAISHLVHRDYKRIGDDFKQLEFIPAYVDVDPIIPALSNVFDAALAGGGAKSINFQALASDLAAITFNYPFRIPPYFALIIRAIGVLEGIALNTNPDFAIIDEAYPFLSKKLLTDDSPRLREALRYLIYGESNVFDVERLIDLLQAFEQFAEVRDDVRGVEAQSMVAKERSSQTREALRFLFSEDGEFFRQFLEDEVVKGVDALGRDAARELAFTIGLRGAIVPDVLKAAVPKVVGEDRKVLENTRRLLSFFLGDLGQSFAAQNRRTPVNPAAGLFGLNINLQPAQDLLGLARGDTNTELQRELAPILREMAPEMRSFGLRIVGRLTDKLASRVLRFTSDRLLGNYYGDGSNSSASPTSRPALAGQQRGASLAQTGRVNFESPSAPRTEKRAGRFYS